MCRMALIQMRCEKADLTLNRRTIESWLNQAALVGVDVVAFPEMSLTGYADPTRYPQAVLTLDDPEVQAVVALTHDLEAAVLFGIIERNPDGKPFITQILAQRGRMLGHYRKITIVDDEVAWFAPGDGEVLVFEAGGARIGVSICADLHNEAVFASCRARGAEIVLECAAPGLYGEQANRNWQSGYAWWEGECRKWLGRYAQQQGLWIAVATQAGRTRDEDFPGGAFVFSPTGERLFTTTDGVEGAVFVDVDRAAGRVAVLSGSSER